MLYEGVRIAGRFILGRLLDGSEESAAFEGYDTIADSWVRVRFRRSPSLHDLRLTHPGIGQFQDHGCVGEWYVSSLDPGEGERLDLFMGRLQHAPVDISSTVAIGLELLTLLGHPHATGAFHGNISLTSLHITPDWGVQILDFPDTSGELTDSAVPFASPERQVGHTGDERSDVYAVAGVLYALFTGSSPFGDDLVSARHGHLYERLRPNPHLPEPLFMVLETAMSKRPDHRYPTTEGFCAALSDAFMEVSLGFPELTLEAPDFRDLPQMAWSQGTLEPALPRQAAPAPNGAPSTSWGPILLAVVLTALCSVASVLAGGAMLLAGCIWLLLG